MATMDELSVKFSADITNLTTGIKKVESQFVRVEKSAANASAKMSAQIGGLGRLFKLDLLIRYGSQLLAVEDRMEQLASTIRDTADRADIGTEALQRLRHAADQNGTSAEAMDSALIRLNKAMGQARLGAEGMGELFAALGLGDLIEKGASTEQMFLGLSEAVAKMSDESQASAVIAKIMGREADRLIELMKTGAVDVEALGDALSRVIPEETINKLDAARDKTEEFKKVLNSLGADAAGAFIDVLSGLRDVIGWLDRQLDMVNQLSAAWAVLTKVWNATPPPVDGGALGGYSPGPQPAAQPKFVAGGRGFLDPSANAIRAPVFAAPSNFSNVRPNEGALKTLLGGGGGSGGSKRNEALEAAISATKQYEEAVADLNFQIEQLGRSEKDAAYQEELRSALSSAGVGIDTARGESIALLVSQMHGMVEAQEAIAEADKANAEAGQQWIDMRNEAGDAVASAFERAILEGESLRETFAGLLKDLARMIFQKMVFDQISSAVSGGLGGFAMGGGVNPGNPYMVGEAGPELFVPKVPGTIVPNRGLGGGGGVTINSVVNAGGGVNKAELQSVLNQRDRNLVSMMPKIMVDKQRRNGLGGAFA